MGIISGYRCGLGFHSWTSEGGKKICKECELNYGRKKCRFGSHLWEGKDKKKFCKFCGISNEDDGRFGYIGIVAFCLGSP